MKFKEFFANNKFELIIFLIISILMLSNFSNIHLWDDEGETVLLAKNTVEFGVPKVYDGVNLVSRVKNQFTSDFIWTWSSWLHIYVTSLSFLILGFSTFSARFLFVIIGILSFIPIVILFKKISINKLHYYLSLLFLVFFVPYYLYSRQARYFALLIFLIPVILISVYNLSFKNKGATWFVIAFALLFHSNILSFFGLIASISIYFLWILFKDKANRLKLLKKLIWSYVLIFLLTFPFALFIDLFGKLSYKVPLTEQIIRNIDYVFHGINSTVPIILLVVSTIFIAFFFYFKKHEAITKQKIFFLSFNGVVPIIILLFPVYSDVRYLIGLLPLWISFLLLPIVFLIQRKENFLKSVGVIIFLLIIFTNFFYAASFYIFVPFEGFLQEKCSSTVSGKDNYCDVWIKTTFIEPAQLKYPFFYYLYELTHDYDGPIEGTVEYLNANGNEDSVVFANNWYFSIPFYTNMKVLNHLNFETTELVPDFIVVNFPHRMDNPRINYLVSYAEDNNYTRVTLPYPDLTWDNRPVLSYHKFWTQPVELPLTIYVKDTV